MNQILVTKLKNKSNKIFFKIQFFVSIIVVITLIGFFFYYILYLKKKENISNTIISSYNIYKLYSNYNNDNFDIDSNIFGIIEIPKINIYYPVFSNLTEENLKVSPCKFYGGSLTLNGNICIAGHNYNNSMFFSNIFLLKNNDEIFIYDNSGKKYIYKVFNIYEVSQTDLSPVFDYTLLSKELTLVTCNNLNKNRFIVKAKQEQQ